MTHTRGQLNTPPVTDMWGLPNLRARPLVLTLLIAVLLHLPALPTRFGAWVKLTFWSESEETEPDGPQQELVIPIELGMAPPDGVATAPPPPAAAGTQPAGAPPISADGDDGDDMAAMMDDDDEPDAGAADVADAGAPEPDAGPQQEADAGAEDVAPGPLKDPFEVAGGASAVVAEHPNVRVFLAARLMRKRAELSKMFGELLTSVPEWNDLLGGTGIDPIQHFDNVLISGPQLRNPKWIVVAADYNISSERMKSAVDAVVKKSQGGGKWHSDHEMPVASIGRHGQRRAVILPDKRLLYVLPAEAEGQIDKLKDATPFSKSNVAISIFVISPWRAVKGFSFPKSIAWMKLNFVLVGDDAFQVSVEGKDASAAEAKRHAKALEAQIEGRRVIPAELDVGIFKIGKNIELIGKPTWSVDGDIIRATAPVSSAQVRRILRFVQDAVLPPLIEKARERKAKARKERAAKAAKANKAAAATSAKPAPVGTRLKDGLKSSNP